VSERVREAMLALLRKLEWSAKNDECPICEADKGNYYGHFTGCALHDLIWALEHDET